MIFPAQYSTIVTKSKKLFPFFFIAVGFCLFLVFFFGLRKTDSIAVVNGQSISKTDYNRRLASQTFFYTSISPLPKDKLAELKNKVLEDMIQDVLLTQFLSKNNIIVTEDEVKKGIEDTVVKKSFGGDWKKYENELKTRYHATLADTMLTYRLEILKGRLGQLQTTKHFFGIWIAKNEPEFVTRDRLPPGEAQRLDIANAPKKQKADEALRRIQAGGNFAQIAKEVSEDEKSASKGGDLGFIYIPKIVPGKAQASLKDFPGGFVIISSFNEIGKDETKLIETFTGYAILRVTDIKEGPLENKTFEEWYSLYRKQAKVKIYE